MRDQLEEESVGGESGTVEDAWTPTDLLVYAFVMVIVHHIIPISGTYPIKVPVNTQSTHDLG